MGVIIDRRAFKQQRTRYAQALFVLDNPKYLPADVATINIGLELSSAFKGKSKKEMSSLTKELERILSKASTDVILDRVDILFDPVWNMDVLKLLLTVGRNRRIYVVWPGTMTDEALMYSEQGRPDWQVYEIGAYNDLYIIRK